MPNPITAILVGQKTSGGGGGGGSSIPWETISLTIGTSWIEDSNQTGIFYQTIDIPSADATCKIDLDPDYTVLTLMETAAIMSMYIENNNGIFKIYSIGNKPLISFTIQATIVRGVDT